MKLLEIRPIQMPDKSFTSYHENQPFAPWHFHSEYELVYIIKGRGKRLIGDNIDKFKEKDLVFLGSFLPHKWSCFDSYYEDDNFTGEAIVIQFLHDFLGEKFMKTPENNFLAKFLDASARGCSFYGNTKAKIIDLLDNILMMNKSERLYALFQIFNIFSTTSEYKFLASPGFTESFKKHGDKPHAKALQHILTNFQKDIKIHDLIKITCMSSSTFCLTFKKVYGMNFKEYLIRVRTGYACRLLLEGSLSIMEIAYESGFQNISNFNRQFKRIKGVTPREFKQQAVQ